MNEFEKQILELLVELQNAAETVRTAVPKPNLGSILARLDGLTAKLPKEVHPQLRHYLQNKSYQKADFPRRAGRGECPRYLRTRITVLEDTIAAIATPPGEGALAIIRLSGPQALAIADRCFVPGGKRSLKPTSAPSHTIQYGHILRKGVTVDEVLLSV